MKARITKLTMFVVLTTCLGALLVALVSTTSPARSADPENSEDWQGEVDSPDASLLESVLTLKRLREVFQSIERGDNGWHWDIQAEYSKRDQKLNYVPAEQRDWLWAYAQRQSENACARLRFSGVESEFNNINFSPTGKKVVAVFDGGAIVWDIASRAAELVVRSNITADDMAFVTNHDAYLVIIGPSGASAWSIESGQQLWEYAKGLAPLGDAYYLRPLSPDCRYAVVQPSGEAYVQVLDVLSGTVTATIAIDNEWIAGPRFSGDSKRVMFATNGGLLVFEIQSGQLLGRIDLSGEYYGIRGGADIAALKCALDRFGHHLLLPTGEYDQQAEAEVYALDNVSSGKRVFTGILPRVLQRELELGANVWPVEAVGGFYEMMDDLVEHGQVREDMKEWVRPEDKHEYVLDANVMERYGHLHRHTHNATRYTIFSPDEKYYAITTDSPDVRIWATVPGEYPLRVNIPTPVNWPYIEDIFTNDDADSALVSVPNWCGVVGLDTGKVEATFVSDTEWVSHAVYNRDGTWMILTMESDVGIRIRKSPDFDVYHEFPETQLGRKVELGQSMQFSKDGRLVFWDDMDAKTHVYDSHTGQLIGEFEGQHEDYADGADKLLTATADRSFVYSRASKGQGKSFVSTRFEGPTRTKILDPAGRFAAIGRQTGGGDEVCEVWNLATGERKLKVVGTPVFFGPNDTIVVQEEFERYSKCSAYRIKSGELLASVNGFQPMLTEDRRYFLLRDSLEDDAITKVYETILWNHMTDFPGCWSNIQRKPAITNANRTIVTTLGSEILIWFGREKVGE